MARPPRRSVVSKHMTMTAMRGSRPNSPDEASGQSALDGSLPANLASLGEGRALLSAWLEARAAQEQVFDMVLVFSELLANAIDASPSEAPVRLCARKSNGQITIKVINHRSELGGVAAGPMPDPEAEGGRGLALAEVYSDKLEILLDLDIIEVSATFVLPAADGFRR